MQRKPIAGLGGPPPPGWGIFGDASSPFIPIRMPYSTPACACACVLCVCVFAAEIHPWAWALVMTNLPGCCGIFRAASSRLDPRRVSVGSGMIYRDPPSGKRLSCDFQGRLQRKARPRARAVRNRPKTPRAPPKPKPGPHLCPVANIGATAGEEGWHYLYGTSDR